MSESGRLNSAPSSCHVDVGHARERVPGARTRAIKSNPIYLGALGLVIMLAGISMIVVGVTVSKGSSNSGFGVLRNGEGVPLFGLDGSFVTENDCQVDLMDTSGYEQRALAAEEKRFGSQVANMSYSDAKDTLSTLPKISVLVNFWVLYSPSSGINIASFDKNLTTQMAALKKAFAGANIHFSSVGSAVQYIHVNEEDEIACPDKKVTNELILKINSTASVAIIVCALEQVNGMSRIYGDSFSPEDMYHLKEGNQSTLGVIYSSFGAVQKSPTSLIHQMGHLFGLPHPYPSYETCKVDGDFISDTEMVYRTSNSCAIETSILCEPSKVNYLKHSPANLYMDTSPNECRTMFSPGQILRMHAMISKAASAGSDYIKLGENDHEQLYRVPGTFLQAWQSDLPSSNTLEIQMKSYFDGLDTESIQSSFLDYSNPFSTYAQYGMLAVREDLDMPSMYSCFPSNRNETSWVGDLLWPVPIHALEIVQEHSMMNVENVELHNVQVQIGDDDGRYQNCTLSFVPLTTLAQVIYCKEAPLMGTSIRLIFETSTNSEICIKQISVLTSEAGVKDTKQQTASRVDDGTISFASALLSTKQSSTHNDLTADKALGRAMVEGTPYASCSTTEPEKNASWSLGFNKPFFIESISFDVPACPATIESMHPDSKFLSKVSSAIKVCTSPLDMVPLRLSVFHQTGSTMKTMCNVSFLAMQGHRQTVSCDNVITIGNQIEIQYDGRTRDSLRLCGVQVAGSQVTSLGDMASLAVQDMYPNTLASLYSFAMDNDEKTCINVNTKSINSSYWVAHFKVRGQLDKCLSFVS